jgi:hypothetical protein
MTKAPSSPTGRSVGSSSGETPSMPTTTASSSAGSADAAAVASAAFVPLAALPPAPSVGTLPLGADVPLAGADLAGPLVAGAAFFAGAFAAAGFAAGAAFLAGALLSGAFAAPIGATFLTAGRLAGLSSTRLAVATRLAAVAALTVLRLPASAVAGSGGGGPAVSDTYYLSFRRGRAKNPTLAVWEERRCAAQLLKHCDTAATIPALRRPRVGPRHGTKRTASSVASSRPAV